MGEASSEEAQRAANRVLEHFTSRDSLNRDSTHSDQEESVPPLEGIAHVAGERHSSGSLPPPPLEDESEVGLDKAAAEGVAGGDGYSADGDEGDSDFVYDEDGDHADRLVAQGPTPPDAAQSALLHRVAACSSAGQLREALGGPSDDQLMLLVSGVRQVAQCWLHSDAAQINLQVDMRLLKAKHAAAMQKAEAQRLKATEAARESAEQLAQTQEALKACDDAMEAMHLCMRDKDAEIAELTASVRQAILVKKDEYEQRGPPPRDTLARKAGLD